MGEIKRTICPGGGCDYSTLENCMDTEEQDLQAGGNYFLAEIQEGTGWSSADTTAVTINGWTTAAANYISIYTTSGARHSGIYNTNKYRLEINANDACIHIYEEYVRVEGLQFYNANTTSNGAIGILTQPGATCDVRISHNILKAARYGGKDSESYTVRKWWNNIFYDGGDGGHVCAGDGATTYFYNNTVHSTGNGIYDYYGGDIVAKNNICNSCTDDYVGTFHTDSEYNVGEGEEGAGSNSKQCAVSFEDEDGDDFHIASGDSCAKNSGVDLNPDGDGYLDVTDDIDGDTRPDGAGTWDIGADEYIAPEVELITYPFDRGTFRAVKRGVGRGI